MFVMRDITKTQIKRADVVFRGRMNEIGFLSHPAFSYSFSTSGFSKFTFGAVTGPAIAISSIFHEMAHAIEFVLSGDDIQARTEGGKYNFFVKKIALNGQLYEQVETSQCTSRECRTFAIQIKLMHMVGFKTDLERFAAYSAKLTTWLPDWFLIDGDSQSERVNWCKNHIIELYSDFNDQEILEAFQSWLDEIHSIKSKQVCS